MSFLQDLQESYSNYILTRVEPYFTLYVKYLKMEGLADTVKVVKQSEKGIIPIVKYQNVEIHETIFSIPNYSYESLFKINA